MSNLNFWNIFRGRKPVAPACAPEDYEAPAPMEPFYRREAPQNVPGNDERPDAKADLLKRIDSVVAQLDEIKGELGDLDPEERASVHDAVTRKAFGMIVSVTPPVAPSIEAPQEPEEEAPDFSDEHRAKVAKLYESIRDDLDEDSKFIDQHWRKLLVLVDLLKPEEDEDANPVGLLLADVAEILVQHDEEFGVSGRLEELAKLAGYRKSDKRVTADDEAETEKEACHV